MCISEALTSALTLDVLRKLSTSRIGTGITLSGLGSLCEIDTSFCLGLMYAQPRTNQHLGYDRLYTTEVAEESRL